MELSKAVWMWNRLRCMSPGEIMHRVVVAVRGQLEARHHLIAPSAPTQLQNSKPSAQWLQLPEDLDMTAYVERADQILQGKMAVFSIEQAEIGHPPNWNRCPKTGTLAPLAFGKTLDYRDERVVGDIKYLWEPSRHLQWITLAQAWHLTGEQRFLDGFSEQLASWLDQCPYLQGAHWTSSLELGIRLINWSIVWQLIGGDRSPAFQGEAGRALKARWLTVIYQHAHFIRGHFSRYSSANNHLIGEAAGLYIGTCTWPYWPQFEQWQQVAARELEREARKQTCADGVNREQAISYQQFVFDFLLFAGLCGRAVGQNFSTQYWQILHDMTRFIAAVMDRSGNVPMIGDADDGYVSCLDPASNFCPFHSMMSTGALLFNDPKLWRQDRPLDDKTRWLCTNSDELSALASTLAATPPLPTSFPDGGYYILGRHFGEVDEIKVVADAGPLGYLGIAAHGHADALAFTVSVRGKEILVDPGTYAYHTQQKWRDYFRGTLAHNTVRVDSQDQSVIGGNFMWLRKATTQVTCWQDSESMAELRAWHDGYQRFSDPVTHERHFAFDKISGELTITDTLTCQGTHQLEIPWHCHEAAVVELPADPSVEPIIIRHDEVAIELSCTGVTGQFVIVKGDEERPLGWVSRRFDLKQAAPTLLWSAQIEGSATLISKLRLDVS